MKKLFSCALALACLLTLPSMTLAAGKVGKPFHGKVTAVDVAANTITVKNKKEEKTFKAEGATIKVNGASGKLSDITNKMKAAVTAGEGDQATAIDATSAQKRGVKKNKGGAESAPAS
ncbi:MAG: hypothetical protein NTZ46_05675 [Verrucomicrobia bacterium]|nr:hypothetical protein [Verrucomicrobiota bacterium]